MPILEWDPGASPEAPGTLYFYEQGKAPSTGFQATSAGVVTAPGGSVVTGDQEVGGDLTVDGALEVTGFTALASAQTSGDFTAFGGGGLIVGTAGGGLRVKEGDNATLGVATLVGGTVTVNTTEVTANSRIFLTAQDTGGTPGALRVSARSAGTSFTITSTSGTDTSTVAWFLVEPAT